MAIKIGNNFMATVAVSTAVVSTFSHGLSTKCYKWPDHASMSQENQNRCLVTWQLLPGDCCQSVVLFIPTFVILIITFFAALTHVWQLRPGVRCLREITTFTRTLQLCWLAKMWKLSTFSSVTTQKMTTNHTVGEASSIMQGENDKYCQILISCRPDP